MARDNASRLIAAHRFGFGASAADVAGTASPRTWLAQQLDATVADTRLFSACFSALPDSATTGEVFPQMLRRAGLMGGITRFFGNSMRTQSAQLDATAAQGENRAMQQLMPYLTTELHARMRYAVASPTPLVERLVWFWSNHFTVSAKRIGVVALAGPFEREAIRPNVLGRFENLLLAVIRHPGMQIYLDNFRSVGPNTSAVGSGFGAQRRTGVNENLAREVLELHTLGDRNTYAQTDVAQLALALTGWGLGSGGRFKFDPAAHEPGERIVLQRRYPQSGAAQLEAIAADLALHPATARHIAGKLLRNFGFAVADEAATATLADVFLRSKGDLRAVMLAMFDLPMLGASGTAKHVKHADEFVVSAWRTLNLQPPTEKELHQQLKSLGEPTWFAPSPAGWARLGVAEFSPDALLARIDWARAQAERVNSALNVKALMQQRFGEILSVNTRLEVERAQSSSQALNLLLTSPEFLCV